MINVVVTLTYEATHFWKDCDIEEVMFLKLPHRHLFYITPKKEVKKTDREIEIILLKKNIYNYLVNKYNFNFDGMSCEDIALVIAQKFNLNYCQVLEDNENGAEYIL